MCVDGVDDTLQPCSVANLGQENPDSKHTLPCGCTFTRKGSRSRRPATLTQILHNFASTSENEERVAVGEFATHKHNRTCTGFPCIRLGYNRIRLDGIMMPSNLLPCVSMIGTKLCGVVCTIGVFTQGVGHVHFFVIKSMADSAEESC